MPRKRSKARTRPSGGDDIVVRGVRRNEPDLRRLARALIELAAAEQKAKDNDAGEAA